MRIKLTSVSFLLAIAMSGCYAAEFSNHAILQPQELASGQWVGEDKHKTWQPSPLEILDLYHDQMTGKTIVACTDQGRGQSSRFICFYDPVSRKVIQTITFEGTKKKLGGSFSQEGKYFTIGTVQPMYKPQDFHIYQYSADHASYQRHSIIPYQPSVSAYLTTPDTAYDRFAFQEDSHTVLCYGAAIEREQSVIQSIKTSLKELRDGFLTSKVLPTFKIGNESLEILDPHRMVKFSYNFKMGYLPQRTQSPNKQHVVFADHKGEVYCLNRATLAEKKVDRLPGIIDNTGTMALQRSYFPPDKHYPLTIGPIDNPQAHITHGCKYPSEQSSSFGYPIMDKNYCLTRALGCNDNGDTRRDIPIGVTLPSISSDNPLLTNPATQEEQKQFRQAVTADASLPSLAQLRQEAPVVVQHMESPSLYNKIVPCVPMIAGGSACIALGTWAYKKSKLSSLWKKRIKALAALGFMYSSLHLYRYALSEGPLVRIVR